MPNDHNRGATAVKSSSVVLFPQPALQLIYDTAPIGLAFLSPDCRYLQINQRLTEICGISVEDHLGRSVRDCVPALADAVEGIVGSIMETGEPVTGIEVAGQRADQIEERSWVTYWHPMHGPNGEIVGVNVAAEEITERKRAEAALQASEREIRSAKDAAEAALQNLQETQNSLIEAEKLAALGRLVAGVAHEINNPVGTSLTVASSLERKTELFAAEVAQGSLKRSSLNEFLEISREASAQLVANLKRAAELIQSFKQVASDRNTSNQRIFDLGVLTEQVAMSLRPGLGKTKPGSQCRVPARIDDEQLSGALRPGVDQPVPQLGRARVPRRQGGAIDIKVRASGKDNVEIVFSDDGCGMSEDVRRKAFDPFFTTRRDQGGTGLGLHIVHSIVTNYLGGRLNLESEPGEGNDNPAHPAARGAGGGLPFSSAFGAGVREQGMDRRSFIAGCAALSLDRESGRCARPVRSADQDHLSLRGRRQRRRALPGGGATSRPVAGSQRHRREPHRRRRTDRDQIGQGRRPRRLHDSRDHRSDHVSAADDGGHAELRHRAGFRAGLAAGPLRIRRRCQSRDRREGFPAIRGVAQGQSGQGDIRRAEQRHHSAFHRLEA